MSMKTSWLRSALVAASVLSVSAAGSLAAAAPAPANEVSGVNIAGTPPTSLVVSIVDKSPQQVLRDVRTAAHIVCHNAYLNGDFGPFAEGYAWCPYRTVDAAYSRYEAILRSDRQVAVASLAIAPPGAR